MLARCPASVLAGDDCTARDVAAAFGVADRTAREWCAAGVFEGATRDELGRWLVPVESVARRLDDMSLPMRPRSVRG